MYRSSNRVFPIILIIVVTIAVIAGLVTVGRYLFGGNSADRQAQEAKVATARDELLTLETDRAVRVTVRGPIVGDDRFRTERISISPTQRVFTIYGTYLEDVEDQRSYDNNMEAYEEFVYALDKAAFTKPGPQDPEEASDIRGICATGRVYEFEVVGSASVVHRSWTSTCKGSPGTFGANLDQVVRLFTAQIPGDTLQNPGGGMRLSW
jgi:hypothetical protein